MNQEQEQEIIKEFTSILKNADREHNWKKSFNLGIKHGFLQGIKFLDKNLLRKLIEMELKTLENCPIEPEMAN